MPAFDRALQRDGAVLVALPAKRANVGKEVERVNAYVAVPRETVDPGRTDEQRKRASERLARDPEWQAEAWSAGGERLREYLAALR